MHRALVVTAAQHGRFTGTSRSTEHRAQQTHDVRAETVTEIAVDERVDAAVAGTEPLRQWTKVTVQQVLLQAGRRGWVGKHASQVDDVQREPQDSEHYDDSHQHPQQTSLRPADVSGRPRLYSQITHTPVPHPDSNERVENTNADEGQKVTRQKHNADSERPKHPRRRPVRATHDELVGTNVERLLSVN